MVINLNWLKHIYQLLKGWEMKKILIWIIVFIFAISITLIGIGCKEETGDTSKNEEPEQGEEDFGELKDSIEDIDEDVFGQED